MGVHEIIGAYLIGKEIIEAFEKELTPEQIKELRKPVTDDELKELMDDEN